MTSTPVSPDFSLIDLENTTTPEEWRALLYNKIVQQKDVFVGNFKKKVINNIDACVQRVEPDVTLESLRADITNAINENKFEFEYQNFIDGIVGATFEYVCQFIIKNSMDNIKRTQNALNSISIPSNSNFEKPHCNESIQLQESSKMFQIQCLSESNTNTTDSGKVIQSNLFNNFSQNSASSLVIMEKKNFENISVNHTENTRLNNYKHCQSTNNSSLSVGLRSSNEVNIENNYLRNAHSSNNIVDDEEDVRTNQAIMSLALKISQQDINFNCSDDFDEQIINNNSSSSSFFVGQNADPFKQEEEYKITNSLKILESLVNIEHNKLEIQKSLTENESHFPSTESFEKKQSKMSNKTNLKKKKKNRKSKKKELKSVDKDERITTKKHKSNCFEYQSKKRKTHKDKSSRSEATSFSSTNNKTLDIISPIKIPLASLTAKYNLSSNELKTHSDNIENITVNEKELNNTSITNDANNSNILSVKISPIASTSSFCEKNLDSSKNKSSISGSPMKTSDYKKIYEKDRKSLFSPDVIITSTSTKDYSNNLSLKKENNHLEKKGNCSSVNKSKLKINNNLSGNKKKVNHRKNNKRTITNGLHREVVNTKSVLNSSSTSSSNQNLSHSTNGNRGNKFKRLKMHEPHDEIKNNSDTNENPLFETSNILEITNVIIKETLENPELKNNESNRSTLEYQSLPEWLKAKYELYQIKPVYIVINPNIKYS